MVKKHTSNLMGYWERSFLLQEEALGFVIRNNSFSQVLSLWYRPKHSLGTACIVHRYLCLLLWVILDQLSTIYHIINTQKRICIKA